MGKDYAGRNGGARRQAQSKPSLPGWVWLLAGIAIGVTVAAGYYISRPATSPAPITSASVTTKPSAPRKIEIPPEEKPRFSFYGLLPDLELVIPKEVLKQKARTPTAALEDAPGESYQVQVGSFKQRGDAEKQKANLALLGIESKIEGVTIGDRDTWFRVRTAPETSAKKVEEMLVLLDENQIDAMVVRVPR